MRSLFAKDSRREVKNLVVPLRSDLPQMPLGDELFNRGLGIWEQGFDRYAYSIGQQEQLMQSDVLRSAFDVGDRCAGQLYSTRNLLLREAGVGSSGFQASSKLLV